MSGIRDFFVEMGRSAERVLGGLADKSEELGSRRSKYEQLESQLATMAADGQLTQVEVDQLLGEIRAAGLDPSALQGLAMSLRGQDGTMRDDNERRFEGAVADLLGKARAGVSDQLFDVQKSAYEQESLMKVGYETAGDFNNKQHQIAMALIRNIGS